MACNPCETTFEGTQSVIVSITKSGSNALVYVRNQGRNIVLLRRILLCYTTPFGRGVVYLRPPPDGVSWQWPSSFLEPGMTALFYTLGSLDPGQSVQAQAEYTELEGRSRSCAQTM